MVLRDGSPRPISVKMVRQKLFWRIGSLMFSRLRDAGCDPRCGNNLWPSISKERVRVWCGVARWDAVIVFVSSGVFLSVCVFLFVSSSLFLLACFLPACPSSTHMWSVVRCVEQILEWKAPNGGYNLRFFLLKCHSQVFVVVGHGEKFEACTTPTSGRRLRICKSTGYGTILLTTIHHSQLQCHCRVRVAGARRSWF